MSDDAPKRFRGVECTRCGAEYFVRTDHAWVDEEAMRAYVSYIGYDLTNRVGPCCADEDSDAALQSQMVRMLNLSADDYIVGIWTFTNPVANYREVISIFRLAAEPGVWQVHRVTGEMGGEPDTFVGSRSCADTTEKQLIIERMAHLGQLLSISGRNGVESSVVVCGGPLDYIEACERALRVRMRDPVLTHYRRAMASGGERAKA